MTATLGSRLMRVLGRSKASARRRPIIFVHIPKTAGTAFSHFLTHNCGDAGTVMETFYGDYSIYDNARDVSLIMGHTFYRDMLPRFPEATYVTWLRDPLSRVISQYKSWHDPTKLDQHWRDNVDDERFGHIYFTQRASFEEFSQSNDFRILCNIANAQTEILSSVPVSQNPQRALASAIENLEQQFEFFGLVERFDESMSLCGSAFGWNPNFRAGPAAANRSAKINLDVTDRAVERILQINALDVELYRRASRLFEDRLRRRRWPFRTTRAA